MESRAFNLPPVKSSLYSSLLSQLVAQKLRAPETYSSWAANFLVFALLRICFKRFNNAASSTFEWTKQIIFPKSENQITASLRCSVHVEHNNRAAACKAFWLIMHQVTLELYKQRQFEFRAQHCSWSVFRSTSQHRNWILSPEWLCCTAWACFRSVTLVESRIPCFI